MQRVLWQIGGLEIRTFGFFIGVGMLVGILVSYSEAKRKKMADEFVDFLSWALVLGAVGARLAFILTSDPLGYLADPLEILRVDLGGLSIHGAILGGIGAGIWYSRRKKVSFWRLADVVVPGLVLAQAIGRVGCDVFGYAMAKPGSWGVRVDGLILHPVQIYESLLDYGIFAFLWLRRARARYDGRLFVEYLFLFSMARGVVEFFRTNPVVWGPFSIAHVASLVLAVAAVAIHLGLRRSAATRVSASISNTAVDSSPWLAGLAVAVAATLSVIVYYAFPPA
ncbi:MAG: prolipoprotein diacylglyceryl transferase [Bacillota bacterium]